MFIQLLMFWLMYLFLFVIAFVFLVTAENVTKLNLQPVACCSAGKLVIAPVFCAFTFCLISRKTLTGASSGGVFPLIFDVGAAKKPFILIREAVCAVKADLQRLSVSWEA